MGLSAKDILNNPDIPESIKKKVREAQQTHGGPTRASKSGNKSTGASAGAGEKKPVLTTQDKRVIEKALHDEDIEERTKQTLGKAKKVAGEFGARVEPAGNGNVYIYKQIDGREVNVLAKSGWNEAKIRRECQKYFKSSKTKPVNTLSAKLIRAGKTAKKFLDQHSGGKRINPLTGEMEYRTPKGKQKGGMKEKSHDSRETIHGQVSNNYKFKDPLKGMKW